MPIRHRTSETMYYVSSQAATIAAERDGGFPNPRRERLPGLVYLSVLAGKGFPARVPGFQACPTVKSNC